jgi:hypothetical protein
MVDWVENGEAPETVTGTKYVNVSFLFFLPSKFYPSGKGNGKGLERV